MRDGAMGDGIDARHFERAATGAAGQPGIVRAERHTLDDHGHANARNRDLTSGEEER
jgi:hypothetical protein